MIRLVAIACFLVAATSFSVHVRRNCGEAKGGGGDVKGATVGPRPTPPTTRGTTGFPCKEDWNITCTSDSECCSGECQKPFCKILGIDETGVKGRKPNTAVKGKKFNTKHKVLHTNVIA